MLLRVLALLASGSLCLLNNLPPCLSLWKVDQPVMCYKDLTGLHCITSCAWRV